MGHTSLLTICLIPMVLLTRISCSIQPNSNTPATAKLLLHTSKTDWVLGERIVITLKLSGNLTEPVLIKPNYEWNSPLLLCENCNPQPLQLTTHSAVFEWTCQQPGVMVLFFTVKQNPIDLITHQLSGTSNLTSLNSLVYSKGGNLAIDTSSAEQVQLSVDPAHLDIREAFVQFQIGRSELLHQISWIFGWAYFLAWICSKYPQLIINYRRKSVVGLNFDFVAFNLIGFIGYAIFNVCITWIPMFRGSYEKLHPHSNIPVQINDVMYALHGVLASAALAFQCCIYERGDQRISDRVQTILTCVYSGAAVLSVMLLSSQLKPLAFIYYFSYVKMVLTMGKYVPQVIFNYRRKSTAGWSVYYILFDLTGGTLSIGQMTCLSINFADPNYFTYNLAKLGIGLGTLIFDTTFLLQHYCLYRNNEPNHGEEDDDDVERISRASEDDSHSKLTVVDIYCSAAPGKTHHLHMNVCNGCCTCIDQKCATKIGKSLNTNFPRQTSDGTCPLSFAKQLEFKMDPKMEQQRP